MRLRLLLLKLLPLRNSSRIYEDLFLHNISEARQLDNLRAMELAAGCLPGGICCPLFCVQVEAAANLLVVDELADCV